MKKCILLGVLLHVCCFAFAQLGSEAYTAPTVVPQAPEVSSLLKYTETPVSYSTGVPNISIPIASIAGRELSASLTASYHSGGHRVTEESTWLGLGWSLSGGGQISRTVRGFVDDHAPRGFIHTDATVSVVKNVCATGGTFNGQGCNDLEHNQNQYDYQPDDFNYSMMGMSGRFMFDQNRDTIHPKGNIIQFPDQKVIITPTYAPYTVQDPRERIIAWDITDTNGTVYHFEEGNIFLKSTNFAFNSAGLEPEFAEDLGGSGIAYTETWDLTRVTTMSGDEIIFEYIRPQVAAGTSGTFWAFNDYNCTITNEQVGVQINGSNTGYNPNESVVTFTGVERSYTELSKITSSQGYIELIKDNTARLDTQFEKFALKGVKVYSTATTPATLVKDVEFVQSYFDATPSSDNEFVGSYRTDAATPTPYIDPNESSFLNKRLKLDEVKFHSVDINTTSNDSYSYTLEYNATELPHKRSKAQDHWGYYNGKHTNFTLIPDFVVTVPGYNQPVTVTYSPSQGSADREVSTSFSKASIIKSITYPEGGRTNFTFESNSKIHNGSTEYFGGLRIKTIETNGVDVVKSTKSFTYSGGHILSNPIYYSVGVGNVHTMHSQSWQPLLTTQGSYVNYTDVEEIEKYIASKDTLQLPGGGVSLVVDERERKTLRTFSPATGNINNWNTPYVNEWSAGQLKSVEHYEDANLKQKQGFTRTVYSPVTSNVIEGWSPTSTWEITDPSLPFNLNNFNPNACATTCTLNTYSIYPGRKLPYYEYNISYEGAKSMLTEKYTHFQSKPFHFNPTKIVTTNSVGDTIETRMKYPYEMNDANLIAENKLNTVLLTEYIKDSLLLQAIKSEYNSVHGIQRKVSVKTGKYRLPVTSQGFGAADTAPLAVSGFEDRLTYHGYYTNGNIQEVSQKDGTHIVYIWGYNETSPIAKIENATYAQVSAYIANIQTLSDADNDRTIGSVGNEGALRTALNNLRTVPALSKAMITTFTYDPMIGVTSMTDSRGNTVYYEYDGFNRLAFVKDVDGNILSENTYHYKN